MQQQDQDNQKKMAGPDTKKQVPELGKKQPYVEKDIDDDIETEKDEEIEEGGEESTSRESWK